MFSPGLQKSGGVIMDVSAGIQENPSQLENLIMPGRIKSISCSTMYQRAPFC